MAALAMAPAVVPQVAVPLTPHQMAVLARRDLPAVIPSRVLAALKAEADALAAARRLNAKLPPPRSDAERLVRMGRLDQAVRAHVDDFDWSSLTPQERRYTNDLLVVRLDEVDHPNLLRVVGMLPEAGWFSYSKYGREAAGAAFLIVQHGDLATQARVLPYLQAFAARGEADPLSVAKMFDRMALREGRPQRYGTQFECQDGRWVMQAPVEDPSAIDTRRAALGVRETVVETRQRMAVGRCG
jgi:hypothetical protein